MGHRPEKANFDRPPSTRKIVRRCNKAVQALTLPKVANYNMRSFFPKIGNFLLDMTERSTDLAFLTEVWEKKEHKKHQFKLEVGLGDIPKIINRKSIYRGFWKKIEPKKKLIS